MIPLKKGAAWGILTLSPKAAQGELLGWQKTPEKKLTANFDWIFLGKQVRTIFI